MILAKPAKTHTLKEIGLLDFHELESQNKGRPSTDGSITPDHGDAYAMSSGGKWLAFGSTNAYHQGLSIWNLHTLKQSAVLVDKSFSSNNLDFSV